MTPLNLSNNKNTYKGKHFIVNVDTLTIFLSTFVNINQNNYEVLYC